MFNDPNIMMVNSWPRAMLLRFKISSFQNQPYDKRNEIYSYYENLVKSVRDTYPESINQIWQIPYDEWALLKMEDSLFTNALQGMYSSIIFAFFILLVTTNNILVSIYSIVSICLVLTTLMACIFLFGWGMGIAESVGLIIFIGFAVDYVVHMCH